MSITRISDGEVEVLLTGEGSARLRVKLPGANTSFTEVQLRQAAAAAADQAEVAAKYLRARLASTSWAS